jgi:hypothetical protein
MTEATRKIRKKPMIGGNGRLGCEVVRIVSTLPPVGPPLSLPLRPRLNHFFNEAFIDFRFQSNAQE